MSRYERLEVEISEGGEPTIVFGDGRNRTQFIGQPALDAAGWTLKVLVLARAIGYAFPYMVAIGSPLGALAWFLWKVFKHSSGN